MAKLLSEVHPSIYRLAVNIYRVKRHFSWLVDRHRYANHLSKENRVPNLVKRHSSRLIKTLGSTELRLQKNKVKNLKICVPLMDGLIIKPGEAFSFCRLIGKPKRGFVEGMELSSGKAITGIGGGICQLANLLHWLVLQPLDRHRKIES